MENSPITADWLKKHRVHGDRQQLEAYAVIAYTELSVRVGRLVAPKLSAQQMAEFEKLMKTGADEAAQIAWLGTAYPAYPKLVSTETKRLKAEIEASINKVKLLKSWRQS